MMIKTIIYPVERNLDGAYYRVDRNGQGKSICFSDLSTREQEHVLDNYDLAATKRLCLHLAECLRRIGDELNIHVEE